MSSISHPGTGRQPPGIETTYRGIRFRSRLEARWAAFFDQLEWKWEYEPFDAEGYIPDFVLLGEDPVLVEVKPAATLTELRDPLSRATAAVRNHWQHDVLAVGLSPRLASPFSWVKVPELAHLADSLPVSVVTEGDPAVGLLAEWWADLDFFAPDHGGAVWHTCLACSAASFRHTDQSWRSRICGHYDGNAYVGQEPAVREAWAEATNIVRWLRPV